MSASVTQVLSSWTRALADGPWVFPWARGRVAGMGRTGARFTGAAGTWDRVFRRACAIATDILRHKRDAVHTAQADRADSRRAEGVNRARSRRRASLAGHPGNRPEDAWLQSVDGRRRRPGAHHGPGRQARGRDQRPDAPRAD